MTSVGTCEPPGQDWPKTDISGSYPGSGSSIKERSDNNPKMMMMMMIVNGEQLNIQQFCSLSLYNNGKIMIQGPKFKEWVERVIPTLKTKLDASKPVDGPVPETVKLVDDPAPEKVEAVLFALTTNGPSAAQLENKTDLH